MQFLLFKLDSNLFFGALGSTKLYLSKENNTAWWNRIPPTSVNPLLSWRPRKQREKWPPVVSAWNVIILRGMSRSNGTSSAPRSHSGWYVEGKTLPVGFLPFFLSIHKIGYIYSGACVKCVTTMNAKCGWILPQSFARLLRSRYTVSRFNATNWV